MAVDPPAATIGGAPPLPEAVSRAFETYPHAVRDRLLELRALIFETAEASDGVGPLTETLKWGEPAYLTEATKAGSTIRLGMVRDAPDTAAVFVNCKTALVDSFRAVAPELTCRGDRAVLLPVADPLPAEAVKRCFGLALTYHLAKRAGRGSKS